MLLVDDAAVLRQFRTVDTDFVLEQGVNGDTDADVDGDDLAVDLVQRLASGHQRRRVRHRRAPLLHLALHRLQLLVDLRQLPRLRRHPAAHLVVVARDLIQMTFQATVFINHMIELHLQISLPAADLLQILVDLATQLLEQRRRRR